MNESIWTRWIPDWLAWQWCCFRERMDANIGFGANPIDMVHVSHLMGQFIGRHGKFEHPVSKITYRALLSRRTKRGYDVLAERLQPSA